MNTPSATDAPTRIAERVCRKDFAIRDPILEPLKIVPNATFRLTADAGRFLVRVHPSGRRSCDEIAAELAWLDALSKHLSVQRPLRGMTGDLVALPEEDHPWAFVTILSWLPGEILPGDRRLLVHFQRLGRHLAEMHRHSADWLGRAGKVRRPSLNASSLERDLATTALNDAVRRDSERTMAGLRRMESTIGRHPSCFGLIHGDPSFGNVLIHQDRTTLIDFDDVGFGFCAYDLAVVLAGAWSRPDYPACREALLNAYQEVRPLAAAETAALPWFMAQRALSLILWAAGRPEDPGCRGWVEAQTARLDAYLAAVKKPIL